MKRLVIEVVKLVIIGSLLGIPLQNGLMAQPSEAIQQLPLNPLTVAGIPVSLNGPTTIRFPSPISDLEGAFISTDPNSSALFLLSFRPGSAFFSVRALVANTNTSLNVVWKNQTYVLELQESKTPWLSVIFTESPIATAPAHHEPVPPSRLLGLLDTAKAFPLLKTQHPEAVAGVQSVRPNTANDYGDYAIKTEEIFRFDDADTLVFRISVSNKTARAMQYLPQSLMVQAGNRVFYQSITDGNGEIPPQTAVPIYFAITGTANGGRNEVSPRNDFLVLLHRVNPPQADSSSPSPPTNPPPNISSSAPPKTTTPPSSASVPMPVQTIAPPIQVATVTAHADPPQPQPTTPVASSAPIVYVTCNFQSPQVVPAAPQPRTYYYSSTPTYYYYPTTPVYYYYAVPQQSYNYAAPQYYYYHVPTPVYYSVSPRVSTVNTQARYFGLAYRHGH